MKQDTAKKAAGYAAAELIKNKMHVGLGTGSTATYFIERLGERCQEGLEIQAVASSLHSEQLARQAGIPITNLEELSTLDIVIDGADEIDAHRRMIKGGGGALLREKILAHMTQEMIIVVDSSKQVSQLGTFPLPIEITPFGWRATERHLQEMGFSGSLRNQKDGSRFITDNGNYIYDVHLNIIIDPIAIDVALKSIPGVIETGLFYNPVACIIVGHIDGRVEFQEAEEWQEN